MLKQFALAGLLAALAGPCLAQTSTTTTTTTTAPAAPGTTTEQYYIERDPTTRRCTVTTTRPTTGTTVQVGGLVFSSRSEAEGSVTKVCTD